MEENNEIMYNEDAEVLDDEENMVPEDGSSGNSFNYGVAALGALVVGGLIAGGVKLAKKIKAKHNKNNEGNDSEKKDESKKPKGLKIGRNKRLQIVDCTIDQRTNPEEKETEEEK